MLSFMSLLVHLFLAKSSVNLVQYSTIAAFTEDFNYPTTPSRKGAEYRKLWGKVKSLEPLQPFAIPRSTYPAPSELNNGFIYAKVSGGFDKIRTSICDLVTVSRLLNATLVIPEIQESTQSKGISSKFKSFSYLYNEEQFIAALKNDVTVVHDLPFGFKEARKRKQFPIFKPKSSASPSFYFQEVLPKLKEAKVIGLLLNDGGCLQSVLPPSLAEYQRLRCRVAYHALRFRQEIIALGHQMVERLRGSGQPYLAYHPGLERDSLAYHGCAELFQDVHTELIQYRRAQMIKKGIINEKLRVDSYARKGNRSCSFMPEEVGLLLRAMGYPPRTRIYLAGSEIFGGQRVLIPLRAMYTNLVDRTSLCSKQDLANVFGPETELPLDSFEFPPTKSAKQLKEEWDKAGPRPRPLPPPPDRPLYRHEKEGWYGWIAEKDKEPEPSPNDLRARAHRLLSDALDYIVSVEADAFFPGFNDDSRSSDFSSLVMGHRLYEMASSRTYRPNREYLVKLLNTTGNNLYRPPHPHNWTFSIREHLNKSAAEEGVMREFHLSRRNSFLSHPIPECSCTTVKTDEIPHSEKDSDIHILYEQLEKCPKWIEQGLTTAGSQENIAYETDTLDDEPDLLQLESDGNNEVDTIPSLEQDEEMDPND